jgi:type I restriction enzyme S subunit
VIHLKNAGTWSGGGTPSKANPDFWDNGDIPWVSPKDMKTFELHDSQDKITAKAINASPVKLVPAGSVLMVVRSGILAHTFPVAIAKTAVTLNQDMKAITPNPGLSPEFLAYQLRAQGPEILKTCTKSGTTVASVETKQLLALPIWVPSVETQFKVVADLDTQLSRLDETVGTLQAIQCKLKQARASILKAAVEGRLVIKGIIHHEQREGIHTEASKTVQRIGKTHTPVEALGKVSPEPLPHGWRWTTVGEESILIRYGTSAKCGDDPGGVPVIRMGNIQGGSIIMDSVKYLPHGHPELPDQLLTSGELLFNRTNSAELVGKTAVFSSSLPHACASYIIRVKLRHTIVPDFVAFNLNSPRGRAWAKSVASQQVGQANINSQKLKSFRFALPPLDAQEMIVTQVESYFSVLDRVEATIDASLRRCFQLRQAVLKRAFRG